MSTTAAPESLSIATEQPPLCPSSDLSSLPSPSLSPSPADNALQIAIKQNDLGAARQALQDGADPNFGNYRKVFQRALSKEMITLLHQHGARVEKLKTCELARRLLVGLYRYNLDDRSETEMDPPVPPCPLDRITDAQFEEGRTRRFGTANPEKMDIPFWRAMVESDFCGYSARRKFLAKPKDDNEKDDETKDDKTKTDVTKIDETKGDETKDDEEKKDRDEREEDGEKKDNDEEEDGEEQDNEDNHEDEDDDEFSSHSIAFDYGGPPIWCFSRFGHSLTKLPDGSFVQIAGEHEDSYDPDFMIYNDVVVHHPDSTPENPKFEIYGYPEDVFPPTDFHTATYVPKHKAIYIIGNNGTMGDDIKARIQGGETPIYRLDVETWSINAVTTQGNGPGFIYHHCAELVGDEIVIRPDPEAYKDPDEDYLRAWRSTVEDGEKSRVEIGVDEEWTLSLDTLTWKHKAGK